VSTHIPLEEIPSVMRAMGFYPSEEKVGHLFLLLLLKEKRAGIIAFTKCPEGQVLTVMLDGSRVYLLAFSLLNLAGINRVVVGIWKQIPQKVMIPH